MRIRLCAAHRECDEPGEGHPIVLLGSTAPFGAPHPNQPGRPLNRGIKVPLRRYATLTPPRPISARHAGLAFGLRNPRNRSAEARGRVNHPPPSRWADGAWVWCASAWVDSGRGLARPGKVSPGHGADPHGPMPPWP
jgi:hypothetical protein